MAAAFEQVGRPPPLVMPAMSATPRCIPTETTNPLSWKANASSGYLSLASSYGPHAALLQRHLGQRGQHVPGARIGHRSGEVAAA